MSFTNNAYVPNEKALAEISELDMAIVQEEKMISEIYEQIGKQYYNSNKDNPDADYRVMISRIKSAQSRIEEYHSFVEKIRAVVLCPKCGSEIATGLGMTHCVRCGEAANAENKDDNNGMIECSYCGQLLMQGTNFCTECGKPIAELSGVASINTDTPQQEEPESREDVADEELIENSNLQSEAPQAEDFEEDKAPIQEETKKCPMCASPVTDEMFFCTSCGEKLK